MNVFLRKLRTLSRRESVVNTDMVHLYSPSTGKDHYVLLEDLLAAGGYPEWEADYDGGAGYDDGDRVTYGFRLWESLVNSNLSLPSEGSDWTEVSSTPATPTLINILAGSTDAGAQRITNLADPVSSQDADTKAARDAAITAALTGLKWKNSVRAATTGNITLSGAQTIDGISIVAGDRVLVKDQSTQTQNGIYLCASGAWTRATDSDSSADLTNAIVPVEEGTANADTTWRQTTDSVNLGSSNIVFAPFGGSSPDASETVKGIAELANQAESETATDATLGNRDHTRTLTARGWRWAWNATKALAQTITAEWTFNDIKLANQAGTGNCLGYLDSTGKFVRIVDFSFNSSTTELTLQGADDSASTYLLKLLNDSGNLVARFANGQVVELGGSTFVIEVGSGVTSGNARFRMNDNQAMGLIFEDSTASKEYISFRTTDGDERFNVRVKSRLDTLSGVAPIDSSQFSATANATNSSVTLIGSIPLSTDEELVHVEVDFIALSTTGAGGFQKIKAAIQRISGGTVQAFGASVSDTIQRTAGTFLFSVDADNTNKRINLNFTQNTSGGIAYLLVANARWTRIVEP